MKPMKITIHFLRPPLIAAVTTLLAGALFAQAQNNPDAPRPRPGGPPDGAPPGDAQRGERPAYGGFNGQRPGGGFNDPNMTEEQRTALREAMEANREETKDTAEKLMKTRREFAELVAAEKTDADAIRKKAEEIGKLEGELGITRAKMLGKLRPVLSKEQFDRLKMMAGGGTGPGFQGRPQGNGESRRPGGPDAQSSDAPRRPRTAEGQPGKPGPKP